jgi:hypothetical protein
MKQVFTIIISFLLISFSTKAQSTQKVQEVFSQLFPQATDIVWNQKENTFITSFKDQEMFYNIIFEADGNFLSSIRRSDEKGLPTGIRYNFKRKHKGKEIVTVSEIINESGTLYYITAQDDKFIYWFKGNTYSEIELDQKLPK